MVRGEWANPPERRGGPVDPLDRCDVQLQGTTGLFVDVRPAGLRWRPLRHAAVSFDPLPVALVAAVLSSPGIVQLEYRTVLGLELVP